MKTVAKNKTQMVRKYKDGTTTSFVKTKLNGGKSKWTYTGGNKRPTKKK